MKKRYLRRFINMDDSFTGNYFNGNIIGLPFKIVTSSKQGKTDTIPRVYLVYGELDNLAKNPNTKGYLLLGPGKIERINIYNKEYNIEHEKILKLFTEVFYQKIIDYFFYKDTDTLLDEELFKKYLI